MNDIESIVAEVRERAGDFLRSTSEGYAYALLLMRFREHARGEIVAAELARLGREVGVADSQRGVKFLILAVQADARLERWSDAIELLVDVRALLDRSDESDLDPMARIGEDDFAIWWMWCLWNVGDQRAIDMATEYARLTGGYIAHIALTILGLSYLRRGDISRSLMMLDASRRNCRDLRLELSGYARSLATALQRQGIVDQRIDEYNDCCRKWLAESGYGEDYRSDF